MNQPLQLLIWGHITEVQMIVWFKTQYYQKANSTDQMKGSLHKILAMNSLKYANIILIGYAWNALEPLIRPDKDMDLEVLIPYKLDH